MMQRTSSCARRPACQKALLEHSHVENAEPARMTDWAARSIGAAWRIASEVASVDIAAGPALAWLHLEGRDFSLSATRDTPVVGGTISTRISFGVDTLNPFAEVTGVWWPSSQAFVQRGAQQLAVDLPAFELYVVIGASLRAW